MKKSKMIEAIAEGLLNLYGGDKDEREAVRDSSKMQRLRYAAEALKVVEKKGMTPPLSNKINTDCNCGYWGCKCTYGENWEPENE